jgi:hypothetical protein
MVVTAVPSKQDWSQSKTSAFGFEANHNENKTPI